jgi:hypothetical protein
VESELGGDQHQLLRAFDKCGARGIERQQIKWPAYTAVMAASGCVLTYTISEAIGLRWLEWAGFVILIAALVSFPISIGIAILRYRLYDIDTLINRTLVYGVLTALLGVVYFGGVVLLQRFFVALAGEKSTLAVVASTLAIAAFFNPLRRRVQGFVDRSFYRRKYDARKTLEAFSATLRDETDLDALSDDLMGVVRETMQPMSLCGCVPSGGEGRKGRGSSTTRRTPATIPASRERSVLSKKRRPSETSTNVSRSPSILSRTSSAIRALPAPASQPPGRSSATPRRLHSGEPDARSWLQGWGRCSSA